jgi:hypothetical protein
LEELNNTGAVVGKGTWSNSGKQVYGSYHYITPATSFFAIKATYDAPEKTIIGTWGYGNSHNDGGIWYMTRKN